jgi:membrane protein implicated in regulation of membrane protease activity
MKASPTDPARIGDAARLLPIVGAFLLMPPIITLFVGDGDIAGVPSVVVYLFGTWLALIGCAAWLARRVRASYDGDPGDPDEPSR